MQLSKTHPRANTGLVKWLKSPTRDSNDIYADPGYGHHYKSWFGIEDCDKKFYKNNDIDCQLGIIHKSISTYEPNDLHNLNEVSQFVDKFDITDNDDLCSRDQMDKLTNHILIPPGSNHSNANYLYKRIMTSVQESEPEYEIPYVSANQFASYTGYHKSTGYNVDKQSFYKFMYDNSAR